MMDDETREPNCELSMEALAFAAATILDMYNHAHGVGDEHCGAIAAELNRRGIEVPPANIRTPRLDGLIEMVRANEPWAQRRSRAPKRKT